MPQPFHRRIPHVQLVTSSDGIVDRSLDGFVNHSVFDGLKRYGGTSGRVSLYVVDVVVYQSDLSPGLPLRPSTARDRAHDERNADRQNDKRHESTNDVREHAWTEIFAVPCWVCRNTRWTDVTIHRCRSVEAQTALLLFRLSSDVALRTPEARDREARARFCRVKKVGPNKYRWVYQSIDIYSPGAVGQDDMLLCESVEATSVVIDRVESIPLVRQRRDPRSLFGYARPKWSPAGCRGLSKQGGRARPAWKITNGMRVPSPSRRTYRDHVCNILPKRSTSTVSDDQTNAQKQERH